MTQNIGSKYNDLLNRNKNYMNNVALSFGKRKITYEELHENILNYAKALYKKGIRENDLVAVCLENNPESVYLVYALDIIGAKRVGLSIFNNQFKMKRDIEQIKPQRIITTTSLFNFVKDPAKALEISPILYDPIDFSKKFDNYESLLDSAIDYLQKTKDYYKCEQCLKAFFNSNKTVGAKQVEYLKRLISKCLKDKRLLHCLLRMCNEWTKEQRFEITLFVISLDKSIETFRECPIAPYPKVMSGSEVPYIDKRIDEYKELIEQLENVDYLEHRVFCNKIIVFLQQQKEQVLKREFIYNF